MKTPAFWYQDKSLSRILLWPFAQLYRGGQIIRQNRARAPYKAAIPVICVGNLTAGGNGKTPTVMALLDIVKQHNIAQNPYILTRGYGGSEEGTVLIDPARHTPSEMGEEPMLLARYAPTIVSADRAAGAKLAEEKGADLIIMDDGFQNPSLHKDFSLIVIDGSRGFGNQNLIPAGPLREPLVEGFTRADAFLIVGEDQQNIAATLPTDKPCLHAHITPRADDNSPAKEERYVAFAGLGHPEKFRKTLKDHGYKLAAFIAFSDHHVYSLPEQDTLRRAAEHHEARLITTEKDAIKLPADFDVAVLPICLRWDNEDDLCTLITSYIPS